ncbi:MAG: hypothetical protein ACJ0QS_09190, partial [Parvicellaceae bacterium]
MRKLYLYIFSLFTLFVFQINITHSQNGISSINSSSTVIETNPYGSSNNYKAFWAQQCSNPYDFYNCGGYQGASGKNVVTPEALNLTLTTTIRNSLNTAGAYTEYADDLNSV